jgi:methylated-DNA-[protein]-cysteine S-methyltransferase
MSQYQMIMDSKIGPLYLVASAQSLQGLYWRQREIPMVSTAQPQVMSLLNNAVIQVNEYLDGKRQQFDLSLEAEGTDFQKSVWLQLSKIPYGETRSYKDIATKLNDPNACRAVGSANGRNPISIIVPCHRVIAANGTLAGFAGGLPIKLALLELEKPTLHL